MKLKSQFAFSIAPFIVTVALFSNPYTKASEFSEQKQSSQTIAAVPCGFNVIRNVPYNGSTFTPNANYPIIRSPEGNFAKPPYQLIYIKSEIASNNLKIKLVMQADGNLVLYNTNVSPAKALWSTQTNGAGDGIGVYFQNDGNLLVKKDNGTVVWASNIYSNCAESQGKAYFHIQDDGNMIMKINEYNSSNQITNVAVLGATNTDQFKWSPNQGKFQ